MIEAAQKPTDREDVEGERRAVDKRVGVGGKGKKKKREAGGEKSSRAANLTIQAGTRYGRNRESSGRKTSRQEKESIRSIKQSIKSNQKGRRNSYIRNSHDSGT